MKNHIDTYGLNNKNLIALLDIITLDCKIFWFFSETNQYIKDFHEDKYVLTVTNDQKSSSYQNTKTSRKRLKTLSMEKMMLNAIL